MDPSAQYSGSLADTVWRTATARGETSQIDPQPSFRHTAHGLSQLQISESCQAHKLSLDLGRMSEAERQSEVPGLRKFWLGPLAAVAAQLPHH